LIKNKPALNFGSVDASKTTRKDERIHTQQEPFITDLALSSYWMRGRWKPVSDFFRAGVDFGFRSFEVSGLRCDTFYDEIHPGQFNIVSFHNPAPPRYGASDAMSSQETAYDH